MGKYDQYIRMAKSKGMLDAVIISLRTFVLTSELS
jgi:hypothetical protein